MVRKKSKKKEKTNADCEFQIVLSRVKLGAAAWRKAAQLLSVFLSRLLFPPTSYYAASVVSPPLLLLVLSRLLAVIFSSHFFEMISYLSHEKFTLQSTRTLSHTHIHRYVLPVCVCG